MPPFMLQDHYKNELEQVIGFVEEMRDRSRIRGRLAQLEALLSQLVAEKGEQVLVQGRSHTDGISR
jgi:hypothetical protein